MTIRNKHILISGASIAGPALAYWLHRYGYRVTVVEKAPELRTGGYRVDIRGVANQVITRMGLSRQVRENIANINSSALIDGEGRLIADIDTDIIGMRQPDDIEIMRGSLSQVLYDATRDDVEYMFDDSIVSLSETAGSVRVAFKSGREKEFDLVIGADGVHSSVRKLTFGTSPTMVHDMGAIIAVFELPNYFGLQNREMAYTNAGKIVNIYSNSEMAKALFIFSAPAAAYDSYDIAQQKQILRAAYQDDGTEIRELFDYLDMSQDFYFSPLSQIHMEHLSQGRVALAGDAGYCPSPASGQGTSCALVGAYVLAGELATADGDHRAAFGRYEQIMRPFIDQNQQLGRTILREMVPSSAAKVWFQNTFIKLLPLLPYKEKIVRRYLSDIQRAVDSAANGIALEEYE